MSEGNTGLISEIIDLANKLLTTPRTWGEWLQVVLLLGLIGGVGSTVLIAVKEPDLSREVVQNMKGLGSSELDAKTALKMAAEAKTLIGPYGKGWGLVLYGKSGLNRRIGGQDATGAWLPDGAAELFVTTQFGRQAKTYHYAKSCFVGKPEDFDVYLSQKYLVLSCPLYRGRTLVGYVYVVRLASIKENEVLLLQISEVGQYLERQYLGG